MVSIFLPSKPTQDDLAKLAQYVSKFPRPQRELILACVDQQNEINAEMEYAPCRTPAEVILEERQMLGDPQKEIGFQISLTKLEMNPEFEMQLGKLFTQGIEYLTQHKPAEALKVYESFCHLDPNNHVVWQNMGVAHILLLDKLKAQECFKRALEINPDYEMPRRNLRILKNATKEDLKRMAEEHRVQWSNKRKEKLGTH